MGFKNAVRAVVRSPKRLVEMCDNRFGPLVLTSVVVAADYLPDKIIDGWYGGFMGAINNTYNSIIGRRVVTGVDGLEGLMRDASLAFGSYAGLSADFPPTQDNVRRVGTGFAYLLAPVLYSFLRAGRDRIYNIREVRSNWESYLALFGIGLVGGAIINYLDRRWRTQAQAAPATGGTQATP